MIRTVRAGRLVARYSIHHPRHIMGPHLDLENYAQRDYHSCGFVAAMVVTHYYHPHIPTTDILRATAPLINSGVDRFKLIGALASLGVRPQYRDDLTISTLRRYVKQGVPVIVSVWPDDYESDHWTVVQGFSGHMVYLVNHPALRAAQFKVQWSDMDMISGRGGSGQGLVCYRSDTPL